VPAIEFDFTTVVAIWMGGVIVLVPLIGLMARYGIAPVVEAVARMRASGAVGGVDGAAMGERFAALEERVTTLTRAVARLEAAESERHAPMV
jgi:hypothetical protein